MASPSEVVEPTRSSKSEALKPRGSLSSSLINKVRPAYQQVADQLRDRILDGSLSPDDRLPPEFELAEIFGVSRSTVREALRVLASRDLIHTTRGTNGGTFVSRVHFGQVSDYLETSLGLMSGAEDVSLANLLEAREVLEVPAAGLAALRRDQHHIDEMHYMLEREKRARDRNLLFREHRNFHGIVVDASGNKLLTVMAEPVFKVLQGRLSTESADTKFWKHVDSSHELIVECIEAGDREGAEAAMRSHLKEISAAYGETSK